MVLQIKNMVCPRCISTVEQLLDSLGVDYSYVDLGKVILNKDIDQKKKNVLNERLIDQGFELLDGEEEKMINTIKSYIIQKVHHENDAQTINLSEQLSRLLLRDYSSISKTFSHSTGITIEQYMLNQRIEKVKELLSYQEMSVSEIALELGFSSVAHLSNQFKKITGMTPSEFKKLQNKPRKNIDAV